MFGDVVIGVIDLTAGDNNIVLGWNNIPVDTWEAKFYVSSMGLKASSEITLLDSNNA